MKNIFWHNAFYVAICLFASVSITSCADWTEVESIDIQVPTFGEQNPQLQADYLKDLNNYKIGNHKLMIVSLDNVSDPGKQAERLTAVPDSVDYICLNNPDNLSNNMLDEFDKVRVKGTKVVFNIDFSKFEEEWLEMLKADSQLTEEDAWDYFQKRTEEMLSIADKYHYDGVIADYLGRSTVSMKEDELNNYKTRQVNFFNRLKSWKESSKKGLLFYGNAQYLVEENINIINMFDYIILKTALSPNGGDLSLKALTAVKAGAPIDRFVVCVQMPKDGDKDKIIGYWNTRDEEGNKILATRGAAWWNCEASTGFERKGMFMMCVQADYYNNGFASVREAISIMNPSK